MFDGLFVANQVRTDFGEALESLLPDPDLFLSAMAEYTKYSNREGVLGNPAIMSLTHEDNKHVVPTCQWWHEHGMIVC